MSWSRASSTERNLACPASAVLPSLDSPGAAADWGRFCHKWMETGSVLHLKDLDTSTNKKYEKLLKEKIQLSGVDREALWPSDGEFETPMGIKCSGNAWEVLALERTGDEEWRKKFSDEWAVGRLDYKGDWFGTPWVDDFKTGQLPDLDSPQVMFYALGCWLLAGLPPEGVVVTITHWPKYPKHLPPVRYPSTKTPEQLTQFYDALRLGYNRYQKAFEHNFQNRLDEWAWRDVEYIWTWARTKSGGPRVVRYSSQCVWCKSKDFCPKWA